MSAKGKKWTHAQRAKFKATMAAKASGKALIPSKDKPASNVLLDRAQLEERHRLDLTRLPATSPTEPAPDLDLVAQLIVAVARQMTK